MRSRARQFVESERTWTRSVAPYREVYARVLRRSGGWARGPPDSGGGTPAAAVRRHGEPDEPALAPALARRRGGSRRSDERSLPAADGGAPPRGPGAVSTRSLSARFAPSRASGRGVPHHGELGLGVAPFRGASARGGSLVGSPRGAELSRGCRRGVLHPVLRHRAPNPAMGGRHRRSLGVSRGCVREVRSRGPGRSEHHRPRALHPEPAEPGGAPERSGPQNPHGEKPRARLRHRHRHSRVSRAPRDLWGRDARNRRHGSGSREARVAGGRARRVRVGPIPRTGRQREHARALWPVGHRAQHESRRQHADLDPRGARERGPGRVDPGWRRAGSRARRHGSGARAAARARDHRAGPGFALGVAEKAGRPARGGTRQGERLRLEHGPERLGRVYGTVVSGARAT